MKIDDKTIQKMKEIAKAASDNAYCPYSKFRVGAAVLSENGEIFSGSNIENASLGLTICAERNAIFQAVSKGHRTIRAIAVFTPTSTPTTPCGACRQVIREFGIDVEIYSFANKGNVLKFRLDQLLPHSFAPESIV